jgi:hypothetical protein
MKIHLNRNELLTLEHLLVGLKHDLHKTIVSDKDFEKLNYHYNLSSEILGKVQTAIAKDREKYNERQAYKRGQNEKTVS